MILGIVTHKGASADSGHYIGFVRQDALKNADEPVNYDEPNDQWIKFDDDKVGILLADWANRLLTACQWPGFCAHGGESWCTGRRWRGFCSVYPTLS